ncbi:MAG: anaerobic ribonucleoside-triphosphate reductase activating protein [Clostridia bacterium]|nr:anaerobic ribonucleoside-triphosphate reductase activating protein [Clostridia bacterium]
MVINGFQKLTLLDYPGRVACTIFTAGCNMRCPFCHNASLVTHIDNDNTFSTEEVLSYLEKRQGILEGVCITGGEPLLQPDIKEFITEIKKLGYAVKLDTNGTFPEKLKELVNEGLVDYVAMDIKNSKAKYKETAGINNLDLSKIEESVDFLINGNMDFEFRTTIVSEFHTVEDIQDIVVWIRGAHKYFLQNFVDSGDLIGQDLNPVTLDTLRVMREKATEIIPNVELRGIS